MPEIDNEKRFVGWAKCFHIADEADRSAALAGYLSGLDMETLLWRISMMSGATIELDADQWVRVTADGVLHPGSGEIVSYSTSIQGDNFELALTETYYRWLARHDAVCGPADRPWWDEVTDAAELKKNNGFSG